MMLRFGAYLCGIFNSGSQRDRHRLACINKLSAVVEVIYKGRSFLSDEEAQRLQANAKSFLEHYKWLGWEARERNVLQYHMVYKFHYMYHMCQDARYVNPKLGGCCLADEDYVGKMSSLAQGCTRGVSAIKLAETIAEKYIRAICARWANQEPNA